MRRLRSARWIAAHLLVLLAAVTMVNLGLWQLRRLESRRELNATLVARMDQPVVPIEQAFAATSDPSSLEFRRVSARGRFDTAREVVLLYQADAGVLGHHVVTPLITADGRVLLVDRGWVPAEHDAPPVLVAAPPSGEVTVTGMLRTSQRRGPGHPTGRTDQTRRLDVDLLRPRVGAPVYPLWMRLEQQDPAQQRELPRITPAPVADEGPHLGYALQWFSFAGVAVIGYVVLMRKAVREDDRLLADPGTERVDALDDVDRV